MTSDQMTGPMPDEITGPWTKSSFTGGQQQCVELAQTRRRGVAVRDSKDPEGGTLAFDRTAWVGLRNIVKDR